MEEEDVVVNCMALFYKEGTEGETFRKRTNFIVIVGLHVHAVSVFGKKSDAVCGVLAYFCVVLRFSDPPYAPSFIVHFTHIHTLPRVSMPFPKILLLDTCVQSMKSHK